MANNNTKAQDTKKVRTNKDNRSNGTFSLVRRNDNRIRLVSDGKTIATVQVGVKTCSIHTATKDVFKALGSSRYSKVVEVKMGPNSYKLSVATNEVDDIAKKMFGTAKERIIAETKKTENKKPAKKKNDKVFVQVKTKTPEPERVEINLAQA